MEHQIIKILQWDGYLEHASPAKLLEKRSNTGKGGYTIFAEMVMQKYGVYYQGLPWCVTFIFAVYENRLLGKPCSGVITLARRMMYKMRWRKRNYTPQTGDLVFCRNQKDELVSHVGIVIGSLCENIISIDGNTVDPSGVFSKEQGGAVSVRIRNIHDKHIVGYADIGDYCENI